LPKVYATFYKYLEYRFVEEKSCSLDITLIQGKTTEIDLIIKESESTKGTCFTEGTELSATWHIHSGEDAKEWLSEIILFNTIMSVLLLFAALVSIKER
jgi:hypothetical protein